ncbi:ABC-type transporter Mla maintaining outer membrane lipid asymmetry, periplasmic component MlaD [Mycobacterium rhizamassiliense]|uniref:ABC-type transporter Mla maintaining outer membrane lipid asymmetry, periplasmic component MlaD n=2 Tax=Mycobacterium TaxID=1763 RepID=A0A2U3PAI2_9MYCO|nr:MULTISPECIES: MlaD family protein [Mycobacterium]SPM34913.1 ABC-type transporter Mla maintaining outer membrane lipid asymmetry, periplasmic component MlaD [Mycobacterium rhizamassiliense]SPM40742.1 ABC-type transporter Mla maintaining outer membrane lipid asymmetry, periplasmic component MlaD [Mycobacterium numidiamassiliense]
MRLSRQIWLKLGAFTLVSIVAGWVTVFDYIKPENLIPGVGHYTVTIELPESGGLYKSGNVTYRGTEVGRVQDVRLTSTGVAAVLSLKSGIDIPSDLDAQVHSQSSVGEQYVALLPRDGNSRPLRQGDVIPRSRTSVPVDINSLLDATNTALAAIPHDNLKTVIDESYIAVGGLGPEIRRIIKGSTALAIDARKNLDPLTNLIDQSQPVLDSQADTSSSIRAWTANLATVTGELQTQDSAVAGLLEKGAQAADEARRLFERLQPTLPIVLANLVSVDQVAITYRNDIEQLLVLLPQGTAMMAGALVPNLDTKQPYRGFYLDFSLNLNLPPPCTTGFLPVQQRRVATEVDYPPRPAGDLYCRVPQDSLWDVRGVRNTPCETVPGKRAPTVKMCESDEQYVPLNDGMNWKGDPNATLSGQGIPQLPAPPGTPSPGPAPPPIAALTYDPATGTYLGPDGHLYTQANLAHNAPKEQTWQSMLMPPTGN